MFNSTGWWLNRMGWEQAFPWGRLGAGHSDSNLLSLTRRFTCSGDGQRQRFKTWSDHQPWPHIWPMRDSIIPSRKASYISFNTSVFRQWSKFQISESIAHIEIVWRECSILLRRNVRASSGGRSCSNKNNITKSGNKENVTYFRHISKMIYLY
jgi:hypothetical protein